MIAPKADPSTSALGPRCLVHETVRVHSGSGMTGRILHTPGEQSSGCCSSQEENNNNKPGIGLVSRSFGFWLAILVFNLVGRRVNRD